MTPEEIRKKLAEAGIGEGWTQQDGTREVKSPITERQKELLGKLAGILEQQIESDKQLIANLHLKAQKMKQGGTF